MQDFISIVTSFDILRGHFTDYWHQDITLAYTVCSPGSGDASMELQVSIRDFINFYRIRSHGKQGFSDGVSFLLGRWPEPRQIRTALNMPKIWDP